MKNRWVLLCDLPLIAIAAFGAFALRFDWRFYEQRAEFPLFLIAALLLKPVVFYALGMYRRYWQYASVHELLVILTAVSASSLGMTIFAVGATMLGMSHQGYSRVILFSDGLLTLVLTGGFRLAIRVFEETRQPMLTSQQSANAKRVLIVGAGAAGVMVARELRRNPQLGMEAIGFLDDDEVKLGKHIAGLKVLGCVDDLAESVAKSRVTNVVIAMPTASGRVLRDILESCNAAGVKSQTIPGVFEVLDGQVSVSRLRNVEISDLLRREPVSGRLGPRAAVEARVVMITGAGGSIGSELARQIALAAPAQLILLGHGENSIFECAARLRDAFPGIPIATVIADIRDEARLAAAFDQFRPSVLFHAAAHKHVPLMEENPEEAVTNNVIGTRNVVRQAIRTGVERLVLISTDKAVSPTSLMGATKRVAEAIVQQAAQETGRNFVAVRFGNVLGSRGSVVNTFKEQIARGGPITVTHPRMTRFFMTIPEAVHLVLEASALGSSGRLYVLDMGEPVRIVDLAKDLIKLSGLADDDIAITFTGVRPGEKLEEALFEQGLVTEATEHPSVLEVVGRDTCHWDDLDDRINRLAAAALAGDRAAIERLIGDAIPGFSGHRKALTATPPPGAESRVH